MTHKVEYDSLLSTELHVFAEDIRQMPVVIEDPMITELHQLNDGLMDAEKAPKIDPQSAQMSDWSWETYRGGIKFIGQLDPMSVPFCMDFWLK